MKDCKKRRYHEKKFVEKIPVVEDLFCTFGISIVEMLLWR